MPTDAGEAPPKRFKPCCAISAAILVLAVVALASAIATFRPRDPTFDIYLVRLADVWLGDLVHSGNLTTTVDIRIGNQNYASFAWQNFTAPIRYAGKPVGEVTVREDRVLQRSETIIATTPTLQMDELFMNWIAVATALTDARALNFTSSVTVAGEVRAFNVLPGLRGSVSIDCFASLDLSRFPSFRMHRLLKWRAWCWVTKKKLKLFR